MGVFKLLYFLENCDSAPCLNGGTCMSSVDGFTCNCPTGYEGLTCAHGKRPFFRFYLTRVLVIMKAESFMISCGHTIYSYLMTINSLTIAKLTCQNVEKWVHIKNGEKMQLNFKRRSNGV